jgi:hypothetical protein
MSAPALEMRHPLLWPEGRGRTPPGERKNALWRHEGRSLTLDRARKRLLEQVYAITRPGQSWRTDSLVLSCSIRFTASGARDRNFSQREPDDMGAAFYFDLDARPHALACDRWSTVADNIAAIAAHIEALRGQERWGVADLRQAFAGHAALPPPDPWWIVLGVPQRAQIDEIRLAFRALSKIHHPDAGGERAAWDRLSAAYDAAQRERG